jgi:hypothetical protein
VSAHICWNPRKVNGRIAVSAPVVHEAIRHEGERELERSVSALAWSGLAAGLSMGFSLVSEGLLRSLTVILPLLANRNFGTLLRVARLWIVVLVSNIAGAGGPSCYVMLCERPGSNGGHRILLPFRALRSGCSDCW